MSKNQLSQQPHIDFHGIKRNCSEKDGSTKSWEYVFQHAQQGTPEAQVKYKKNSDYFPNKNQVIVSKCCKKERMANK